MTTGQGSRLINTARDNMFSDIDVEEMRRLWNHPPEPYQTVGLSLDSNNRLRGQSQSNHSTYNYMPLEDLPSLKYREEKTLIIHPDGTKEMYGWDNKEEIDSMKGIKISGGDIIANDWKMSTDPISSELSSWIIYDDPGLGEEGRIIAHGDEPIGVVDSETGILNLNDK